MQWLLNAVSRAGWESLRPPVTTHQDSISEVWSEVAKSYSTTQDAIAEQVAAIFQLPRADLSRVEAKAIKLVPERIARRHNVMALSESYHVLTVATSDPTDFDAEQALAFSSGRRVSLAIATPEEIQAALNKHYSPESAMQAMMRSIDAQALEDETRRGIARAEFATSDSSENAPSVQLANLILGAAIAAGASDIHFEPSHSGGSIRFRVDGVLRQYMQLPLAGLLRVVARIKILGKLDIADRLRPQDGRARISIKNQAYDLRISTVPTRDAEKAVIRILHGDSTRDLEHLGLAEQELQAIRQLISHREGIVVVTGPTGSGKTTTLYSAIRALCNGKTNIMTVEDPVEYELGGVTQIQIDPKRNVTFASSLRAILRQDPDVVFVGEIRDSETAQVALQASMTGHLVLTTLHTNDAVGVVQRLVDLGLDRAGISGSFRGALGQRLVRKVCPDCAVPVSDNLTGEEQRLVQKYGVRPSVRATGCARCAELGYKGRIPLVEVLVASGEIKEKIAKGATSMDVQRLAARQGMRTIREIGLEHVSAGETTLDEIERVLGEAGTASSDNQGESERPRILVVDDDPLMRELALVLLREAGFDVEQDINGLAASERLQKDASFSLVVLDLKMPLMDGRELLMRMKSSVPTMGIPVVFMTGSDDAEQEIQLMNEGADDYIQKPLDADRFVARVKAVLRRAKA